MMVTYFFPGCKYSRHNPEGSLKLKRYCENRFGFEIADCCSVDYIKPTAQDRIIFQCPTCGLILAESAQYQSICSIYEFLLPDETFPWPDYKGAAMTIQDCWRTRNNTKFLEAVREVLRKMNMYGKELDHNYGRADFCGATLYRVPSARYETLAHQSLVEQGNFHPCPEEEQKKKMLEYGKQYKTKDVVCVCTGCMEGVEMSGHRAVHLLDLAVALL